MTPLLLAAALAGSPAITPAITQVRPVQPVASAAGAACERQMTHTVFPDGTPYMRLN